MTFTVKGLKKGDWSDIDIFFRGAGDIIGATKLDEEILAEMLREEEAGLESEEDEVGEDDTSDSEEVETLDESYEDSELAVEDISDAVEPVSNPGDIMSWNSGGDEI